MRNPACRVGNVVGSACREAQELGQEISDPWRVAGEKDLALRCSSLEEGADPYNVPGVAEVTLVLWLGEPACLTCGLARGSAGWLRAVALMTPTTRIGSE